MSKMMCTNIIMLLMVFVVWTQASSGNHLILWEEATTDVFSVEMLEDPNLSSTVRELGSYGDPNVYIGLMGDIDGDLQSEFCLYGKVPGLDGNIYYRDFDSNGNLGSALYSVGNLGDATNYIPVLGDIDGDGRDEAILWGTGAIPSLNGNIYFRYIIDSGSGGAVLDMTSLNYLGNLGDAVNYEIHFGDINGDGQDEALLWGTNNIPSLNGDLYFRYITDDGSGGYTLDMSSFNSLGNIGDPNNYDLIFHDMDGDGTDEAVISQQTAPYILWKKIIDDGFGNLELDDTYTEVPASALYTVDFGNPDEFIPYMASFNICDNPLQSDVNTDCQVDLLDFAALASEWLDCGYTDPADCPE